MARTKTTAFRKVHAKE